MLSYPVRRRVAALLRLLLLQTTERAAKAARIFCS